MENETLTLSNIPLRAVKTFGENGYREFDILIGKVIICRIQFVSKSIPHGYKSLIAVIGCWFENIKDFKYDQHSSLKVFLAELKQFIES